MWESQKPPAPARVGPRESRGLTRARVPPRSRPLLPGSRTTTRRIRVAPSRTRPLASTSELSRGPTRSTTPSPEERVADRYPLSGIILPCAFGHGGTRPDPAHEKGEYSQQPPLKATTSSPPHHPGLASLAKRSSIDPGKDVVQGNEGWLVKVKFHRNIPACSPREPHTPAHHCHSHRATSAQRPRANRCVTNRLVGHQGMIPWKQSHVLTIGAPYPCTSLSWHRQILCPMLTDQWV